MAQEDEKKAFTVKDRRRFDASGNARSEKDLAEHGVEAPRPPGPAQPRPPPPARPAPPAAAEDFEDDDPGPEVGPEAQGSVGFAEFALSIATNAVLHLGGESKDGRIPGRVNLPLAAQHIDIIAMLAVKTRGNLDRDEAELLESLLYDLRMKYVAVAQAQGRGA